MSERNVHTVEPARMPANGRTWLSPSDPGAPTGFRLMVTTSGYRAYYLIYRPPNGDKARAYRIGSAEDLSYKEAKTKAEAIRGIVADGKDPVGEEQAARGRRRSSRVVTVRDVFDYFLEVHRTRLDHKTILGYEETRRLPSTVPRGASRERHARDVPQAYQRQDQGPGHAESAPQSAEGRGPARPQRKLHQPPPPGSSRWRSRTPSGSGSACSRPMRSGRCGGLSRTSPRNTGKARESHQEDVLPRPVLRHLPQVDIEPMQPADRAAEGPVAAEADFKKRISE